MKKFLLKTLNVVLNIIMVISVLYAVFNLVVALLPVEIQTKVFEWLHMSGEYIATFSISSIVNAAVLVGSKLLQTHSRINLTNLVSNQEHTLNNNLAVNEKVVERTNVLIDNIKVVETQLNAILTINKVNAERNIKASEKLVNKAEKEAYKSALQVIEEAQASLERVKNITSVYERTEIKEVIVEKETDPMSGRV